MISLSKQKLKEIVSAESVERGERLSFSGVEYDSREVRGGELFVALKGAAAHGHNFVRDAIARGAAMCLVEDNSLLATLSDPHRILVVPDTLQALWQLATWWRKELKIPVLAVTGSVGKTSVKELSAAILLRFARGNYALKSHNNHVGLPYTILRTSREHSWLVLEMGMNHPGEIRELTKIAMPNVAVITCVAPAHIGAFNSIEEIAAAKCEIIEGLGPQASLVINGDDAVLEKAVAERRQDKVYRFGTEVKHDARVTDIESQGLNGISFGLRFSSRSYTVKLGAMGQHNAFNAACAALACKLLVPTIRDEDIQAGLTNYRAPLMRLQLKQMSAGQQVIDDSYNANPASVRAALNLVKSLSTQGKRVGVILGDMLELGTFATKYHEAIGSLIAESGPSFIVGVGEFAELITQPARTQQIPAFVAHSPAQAAEIARSQSFDILLVKGSRGVGLDKAVEALLI